MSLANKTARKFSGPKSHTRLHVAILVTMLVASVSLNFLLSRKVSALRDNITLLKNEGRLQVDASVPPIEARDANDNSVSVSYEGSDTPTVLYVVSPQCGWCARNLANIKSLAQNTRGRYRFIALSLSEKNFKDYVAQSDLGFPAYDGISDEVRATYKLGGTPQTIVVSKDGRVQKSWTGAYADDIQQQVEEFFGTSLPGLLPAANKH